MFDPWRSASHLYREKLKENVKKKKPLNIIFTLESHSYILSQILKKLFNILTVVFDVHNLT